MYELVVMCIGYNIDYKVVLIGYDTDESYYLLMECNNYNITVNNYEL